jgi:hypothetical protein
VNNIVEDVIEAMKKKEIPAEENQQAPSYNFPLLNYPNYPAINYGAGQEISKMRIEEERLKLRQMQMYYYGMFNSAVANPSQMMGSGMGMPFGNVATKDNGLEFPIKFDQNSFALNDQNQD